MSYKTDLPVMKPFKPREPEPLLGFRPWHFVVIASIAVFGPSLAFAQAGVPLLTPFAVLLDWVPLLLQGFIFNLAISFLAMALGTALGALLGLGQISLSRVTRGVSWFLTQFFRNAPWLVLLFFAMFLLPFEINLLGLSIPFPDWFKAILGLSLPVMANVSEIVRGAVKSLPSGQWEAAESLAYSRRQTLWLIILPQCVKRMLPPWMNLYSILTMATVLASIVGVSEVMTLTGQALAAEGGRPELLAPFYGFVLLLFFAYCYPIARFTVRLERKFAVIN
ncbi:inner membrane amino-acid ABC transporter permease protein YhdY [Roseovarius sp. A-2]|uniref:amino acid ABC transporter permease n=1 Tax=Roseovarius sp. A-2 TaxID=1570360 RepID=UPI0009B5074E|nr:amino acid ABC transporter permease [Roseovarius sp. A-2]GAW32968.1 inner membrane amino-acid ABC transporter permease protein YhdY [Roseovarius sp. A-2]